MVALALLCLMAAQAVSFAILLIAPASAPPAVTPAEVAAVVASPSPPAGSALEQREVAFAPFPQDVKPYAGLVARTLTTLLAGRGVREVRVRSLSDAVSIHTDGAPPVGVGARAPRGTDLADAPFPSFETAVLTRAGIWIVIAPRESLLPPGYLRIAIAFALSAILLAPLTWWSARRLTRPLQLLASASRALGCDPGAPPLPETGPREVRDASVAFNTMQAGLSRHIDERATLMAAIAHDLRTPLTSLRLRAETVPERQRSSMVADISRMESMVSDLLLFVRDGRVSTRRERVDLAALAMLVAEEASSDDVVAAAPSIRADVFAEPASMRRVVENLVGNAVTYAGSAELRVGMEGSAAWIEVLDAGPGIPPQEIERVFEPFARLEASRSRDTGGVGLGLAIARSVVRAHGGDVILRNVEGGGLAARLTLPAAPESASG